MPIRSQRRTSSASSAATLGHPPLDGDGALDGVDDAGELAQRTIADQLDQPAAVLAQQRLDQIPALGFQALERPTLVALHQTGVADHVGREDGHQSPVSALGTHAATLRAANGETYARAHRDAKRGDGLRIGSTATR